MKSMAVVLIVLALVAGVAVNGSDAQPLPGTSVAFRQCLGGEAGTDQCQIILSQADTVWNDDGVPEFWGGVFRAVTDFLSRPAVRQVVRALATELFERLMDYFFGFDVSVANQYAVDSAIFDPTE